MSETSTERNRPKHASMNNWNYTENISEDFISTLRHMQMCNMRSYYIYKYKEKHDKINMGLQLQNTEIQ